MKFKFHQEEMLKLAEMAGEQVWRLINTPVGAAVVSAMTTAAATAYYNGDQINKLETKLARTEMENLMLQKNLLNQNSKSEALRACAIAKSQCEYAFANSVCLWRNRIPSTLESGRVSKKNNETQNSKKLI